MVLCYCDFEGVVVVEGYEDFVEVVVGYECVGGEYDFVGVVEVYVGDEVV